jgi:hypothetical protein
MKITKQTPVRAPALSRFTPAFCRCWLTGDIRYNRRDAPNMSDVMSRPKHAISTVVERGGGWITFMSDRMMASLNATS